MITVTLFSSNNFFSKIIQWFLGSKIGHSAIGFQMDGRQYFIHAEWAGVQITPREVVLATHTIVAEFSVIPDIQGEVILAQQRVGQSYDLLTLFGYLPVLLGRKFGIGVNNPLTSKSAEVCSQFVIEVDTNHLIHEFDGLDPADITPPDLYRICKSGSSFKQIAGS